MGEFTDRIPAKERVAGSAGAHSGFVGFASFVVGLALVVLALIIVGAVLMYQSVYADRVYLGVSSVGVDLGADTRSEAQARLAARFDQYARTPITLRYGSKEWKATPTEMGLRLDPEKTADAAFQVGREGGFLQQLRAQIAAWRGGATLSPSFNLNQAQQDTFFQRLARQIDQATVDARVIVQPDLQVRIAPSQAGRTLNTATTIKSLEQAFLALSTDTVDLIVEESQPKIVEANAAEAKETAEKMLAVPLVLRWEDKSWTIEQKDIQRMIIFAPQDEAGGKSRLLVTLDDEKLTNLIGKIATELDKKPQNARFDYSGGNLSLIRQSTDGLKVNVADAVNAVKRQATLDQRTLALPAEIIRPAIAAQDIGVLAATIKDKIEEASTVYGNTATERKQNIELAARRLNGVVVAPGEIFSFNEEMGPSTIEAGFKTAWGIVLRQGNMQTVPAEAGGICQVSTTLFHSVFWAGYQIEERLWHLYWIPRYGVPPKGLKGLDSTVDAPYVDLKFKNNTSSPILIQAKTDGQNITFALYGQKPTWQVKVDPPIIENVVKASTQTFREEDPTQPVGWSIQTESAQDGFKSTIVRTVTEGDDQRVLKLISEFRPSRNVIRVGTKPVPVKPPPPPQQQPDQQQPGQQQPGQPQPGQQQPGQQQPGQ